MTTPTDDEIVAHMKQRDWIMKPDDEMTAREALRLAREGLPVKDEARTIWKAALARYEEGGSSLEDCHCRATATIRTFLATRDAERDADMAELVESAKRHRAAWPSHSDIYGLSAALAKLERKP
jgi:hypothetical protein